jgi:hypothetical protein
MLYCTVLLWTFPNQVNLALKGLPKFRCLPQDYGQHRTTTHLLPDESAVMKSLTQGFADVQAGRLPEFPTIEWYFHTTNDPSVQVWIWAGSQSVSGASWLTCGRSPATNSPSQAMLQAQGTAAVPAEQGAIFSLGSMNIC